MSDKPPTERRWERDTTTDHHITVHEKQPDHRPVLYDHKGNPLTWERRRIGFGDPKERRP